MENTQINPSNIYIKEITELPIQVRNALHRSLRITTLEELLELDYETIRKARNLGNQGIELLKQYIHNLGYTIKGEYETLEEIIKAKKAEGIILLEETISEPRLYQPLYRNGIYTLEELIINRHKISEINGYGPTRRQLLQETLASIGISLELESSKE